MMDEITSDKVLREDLEYIAAHFPFSQELSGKTVLVTGATGLIGSQIVRVLLGMNRLKKTEIKVIAFVRSQEKAGKVFGGLLKQGELELAVGDINQPITLDGGVDYIIHGASATSSQYFVSHPVETIFTAIDGTRHVLELAAQKRVSGFVYLSSLEVYGTPAADVGLIDEAYSGYLDPPSGAQQLFRGEADGGVPVCFLCGGIRGAGEDCPSFPDIRPRGGLPGWAGVCGIRPVRH